MFDAGLIVKGKEMGTLERDCCLHNDKGLELLVTLTSSLHVIGLISVLFVSSNCSVPRLNLLCQHVSRDTTKLVMSVVRVALDYE